MNPRLIGRVALGALLLGGIVWAAMHPGLVSKAAVEQWLASLGPWAPVAFVAAYAVAAPLFLPGSALTLAGGALFGPVAGTAWSLVGATLGATLSFLIGRTLAGDVVRRLAGPRLDQLLSGVERDGWRFVALVRLVPLFPFNLSNYALGLTRIRLMPYVLTSLVCMAPGAAVFAFAGHGGRTALSGESGAVGWGLAAIGLLAVIALVPRLVRQRPSDPELVSVEDLSSQLDGGRPVAVLDVRHVSAQTTPSSTSPAEGASTRRLPRR